MCMMLGKHATSSYTPTLLSCYLYNEEISQQSAVLDRSSDSVMCENQIVLIIVLITLLKKNRWLSLKVFHIRIF